MFKLRLFSILFALFAISFTACEDDIALTENPAYGTDGNNNQDNNQDDTTGNGGGGGTGGGGGGTGGGSTLDSIAGDQGLIARFGTEVIEFTECEFIEEPAIPKTTIVANTNDGSKRVVISLDRVNVQAGVSYQIETGDAVYNSDVPDQTNPEVRYFSVSGAFIEFNIVSPSLLEGKFNFTAFTSSNSNSVNVTNGLFKAEVQ